MDEIKKLNKIKKIIYWIWNVLMVYIIVVCFFVWQDAKNNPQDYQVVDNKQSGLELAFANNVYNSNGTSNIELANQLYTGKDYSQYSTTNQCKPLMKLYNIYNKYFSLLIPMIACLVLIEIGIKYYTGRLEHGTSN